MFKKILRRKVDPPTHGAPGLAGPGALPPFLPPLRDEMSATPGSPRIPPPPCAPPPGKNRREFQGTSLFCGFPAVLLYNNGMESVAMHAQVPSRESIL